MTVNNIDKLRRVAADNKSISQESVSDNIKKIIDSNMSALKRLHPTTLNNGVALNLAFQEKQHQYVLSVDGISAKLYGTLDDAKKKLCELSNKINL